MSDQHNTDALNLDWASLNQLNAHLYDRLQQPILKAIEQVYQSPRVTVQQLQLVCNRLQAWSDWIKWREHDDLLGAESFVQLHFGDAPTWVFESLNRYVSIKMEHSKPLYIHPPTFYEALLLLSKVAHQIGKLSHIMTSDANPPQNGVWIRIVFSPPATTPYEGKTAVLKALARSIGNSALFELTVIADLLRMNSTQYSLQNNTRTGFQAFAILVPANAISAHEIAATLENEQTDQRADEDTTRINTKDPNGYVIATEDPNELPTLPMPVTSLYEQAERIDRNDNILTQIQDVLLDYIATPALATKPESVIHNIYLLLQTSGINTPELPLDRIKLTQVYDVLQTSPLKLTKPVPELNPDEARLRLGALQQLLLEPFLPIRRDPSFNIANFGQ